MRDESKIREVSKALDEFSGWLSSYGETSRDHQTFFAGPFGGRAKALYYRNKLLGVAAVAPMIFFEAFLPSARICFHRRVRFPIADAHYAMAFAFMFEITGETAYLDRAIHFLCELQKSRCSGFRDYCWGYPFDWVWRGGVIRSHTPLITSTPYAYEAFLQAHKIAPRDEWLEVLASIVRHACRDIRDYSVPGSDRARTCSYTPFDEGGVVNASAYRAAMLTSASRVFDSEEYWAIAERNLWFVLESQNDDGSWPYAKDGVRNFVDHFHTCFVMKALAKIHRLTGHAETLAALNRGVRYYLANLFAEDGLPRPFALAPRLTVYERELYDCAECINLCLLLRDRFPALEAKLEAVVAGILKDWVKRDGSFRSRRLMFGWDNVPMHRWGQSQMFRSLAFYSSEAQKSRQTAPSTINPRPSINSQLSTLTSPR